MKFFEYIKNKNGSTIKLFGKKIFSLISDYNSSKKNQFFFGGIISTIKDDNPIADYSQKDFQILQHSFLKRIDKNNYKTYYIAGKKICSISLIKQFKKQYIKYFDNSYDDIYILNANSGEIYLILTYLIDILINQNNSKKPLLIATNNYHIDMIKMICPHLPYVYIKRIKLNFLTDTFKIDNFRFFLLFSEAYFKQTIMNIKNNEIGKIHYFKSMLMKLNINEADIVMRKVAINKEDERNMLEKISKTGLNLDKFVFIVPEAKSCQLYNDDFWCLLINSLQERGYDVFINLVTNDINLSRAKNYKTANLSFAEAYSLVTYTKKIVSLRNGFIEFLSQTGVPIDILYTRFRYKHFFEDIDSYHVLSGFGLTQIPFIDKTKIQEFNTFEMSPNECLQKILTKL